MATGQEPTSSFDITTGLHQLLDMAGMLVVAVPLLALALMLASHVKAVHHRPSHPGSIFATRSVAGSRHLFGETSAGEFHRQAQAERRGTLSGWH